MGGPVNRQVVAALRAAGLDAVGLSGVDGGLLTAHPASGGLWHVGDIAEVRVALLESFLLAGLTPVIAPMAPEASGGGGPPLNVNADDAARSEERRVGKGRRCRRLTRRDTPQRRYN